MRLAGFIETHAQDILREWEAFAATRLPAAGDMNALELRNHAPQILQAIAADLRMSQSAEEQYAKSQGRAPIMANAPRSAAAVHGIARARSGFDVKQMVSEYRALRATVLRTWTGADLPTQLDVVIEDTLRFNEAIDQAITESIALFTDEIERGRNLFLGILGHELRSPLNVIQMTSRYLSRRGGDAEFDAAVRHLVASGERMRLLLDDLREFSRATLIRGIVISPAGADLAQVCTSAIDEIRAAEPSVQVHLHTTGDLQGFWDVRRVHQVLSNLLSNALSYQTAGTPIVLEACGSERESVVVSITNEGPQIPSEMLRTLFEPLQRGAPGSESSQGNHLGLGLFVAREIVHAHRGEIAAQSTEGTTVFRVTLPRRCRVDAGQ